MSFFSGAADAWRETVRTIDEHESRERTYRATLGYSLCNECGATLTMVVGICPHHHLSEGDDWSRTNRIMCSLFHRGIEPPRLDERDRAEPFWAAPADA
jgi:hypothetical protein